MRTAAEPAPRTEPEPSQPFASLRTRSQEFTAGGLVGTAVSVWWKNLGRFSVVSLLALVPPFAAAVAMGARAAYLVGRGATPAQATADMQLVVKASVGLALAVMLVETGALAHGTVQHLAHRPVRIGAMLKAGFRRAVPVVAVGVMYLVLVAAGTVLLVVPGLVVASALVAAIPAVVAERIGPIAALRRSVALTKGHGAAVMGALVVLTVGVLAVGKFFDYVVPGIGLDLGPLWGGLAALVALVLRIALTALPSVLPAVVYHDLRVAKEGTDTSELATIFE